MRYETSKQGAPVLVLSKGNLQSLLAKLEGNQPRSSATLLAGDESFAVKGEQNDVHYRHGDGSTRVLAPTVQPKPVGEVHKAVEAMARRRCERDEKRSWSSLSPDGRAIRIEATADDLAATGHFPAFTREELKGMLGSTTASTRASWVVKARAALDSMGES